MRVRFTLFALLLLSTFASASVDLGWPTDETPYDAYLSPVRNVLQHCRQGTPTMERACALMNIAWTFRYVFEEPYRPQNPSITAKRQCGDCKDKALWLCQALGDRSVHFIVGKLHATSAISHAWLLWQKDGRWWILDPTNCDIPIAADSAPADMYLPLYSFTSGGSFVHNTALVRALAQGQPMPKVASNR